MSTFFESNATSLPYLPLEVWINIFHKLPIRSVFRFKPVCKEWCSIISGPHFRSAYNPRTITNHPVTVFMIRNPARIISDRRGKISSFNYEIDGLGNPDHVVARRLQLPIDLSSEESDITVLGSCNGLVCLYNKSGVFWLLNPYTGEEKLLKPSMAESFNKHLWMGGFCHDHVSNDYKAVYFLRRGPEWFSFYVVNFKQERCIFITQRKPLDFDCYNVHPSERAIVVNGNPHWLCSCSLGVLILYFEAEKEEFGMFRYPEKVGGKRMVSLAAMDGELSAGFAWEDDTAGLEVWAMKDYGKEDSWAKLFVIPVTMSSRWILLWKKDDDVLATPGGCCLTVHGVRREDMLEINLNGGWFFNEIIAYVPSLVSPIELQP